LRLPREKIYSILLKLLDSSLGAIIQSVGREFSLAWESIRRETCVHFFNFVCDFFVSWFLFPRQSRCLYRWVLVGTFRFGDCRWWPRPLGVDPQISLRHWNLQDSAQTTQVCPGWPFVITPARLPSMSAGYNPIPPGFRSPLTYLQNGPLDSDRQRGAACAFFEASCSWLHLALRCQRSQIVCPSPTSHR